MKKSNKLKGIFTAVVVALIASLLSFSAFAASSGDYEPVTGVNVTVSGASNTSHSSGIVTVTAKGSGGLMGFGASSKTATITITNDSDSTATVSFDWAATSVNELKIDGNVIGGTSGKFSKLLDPTKQFVVTITTAKNSTTNKLVMSNFNIVAAKTESSVTVEYNESLGSVSAGGSVVASGSKQKVSLSEGISLTATEGADSTFVGWINTANNQIFSRNKTYTLIPESDTTIRAVFAENGGSPVFMLGGSVTHKYESKYMYVMTATEFDYYTISGEFLFENLADATKAASESSKNSIVLMNNAVLPAGTYIIPAEVNLLIPFDDANTMYTTGVQSVETYAKPTEYRTLTMADGANLIINGSMSVSAKQTYAQGAKNWGCAPSGAASFVRMQGKSKITVNNGGALYAYGFITGSGSVTANSGATIYEMFQFRDFRGGSQSTDMQNGVFPLSQYYVQNIEVPLTLYFGATEYAYTTIYMSSADFGSAVKFISGSGAMFNLTSGHVVKAYDGTTDRLIVDVYGDMSLSNVKMQVSTSSIDSKEYVLGINGNITVNAHSGTFTIKQDLALFPGAKFNIEKDATVKLNSGYSIYVYDADQWGTFVYSKGNLKYQPVIYAPGQSYTRTEADLTDVEILVKGTLDASAGYLYTTADGANICGVEGGIVKLNPGTKTITHQLVQGTGYTEIPITPAKLKNADGSYVTPKAADTFTYTDDKWVCKTHTLVEAQESKDGTTYSLKCGNNCGTCMASVTVAYRLEDYLWLNATVESDLGYEMADALYQGNYVIRAVGAAEIPNSLLLTFSHKEVSCSLEMNLAAYKTMITDDEDIALIEAMLIYGEAVEDMFGNANKNSAEVTAPSDLPDATQMKDQHESAGNVTVSRYGMTIGFDNCLQFIYGFKVNGETGITDWSNILEIGLLYSPEAGELLAQNSSSAYILYQNEAWSENSGNLPELPEGVTLQDVPKDSTLTKDQLAEMLKDNGCYMITYNMEYADYGTSYNYRPYILFTDGSVAYGEQFAYSLATYIGNRLGSTANKPTEAEQKLLYAVWDLKTQVATWLTAKEGAAT